MSPRRLIILGTGTGVGKTFATVALAQSLRARGLRVLALKPIESGVEPDSEAAPSGDAGLLGQASVFAVRPFYALREPISPHLAARHTGIRIELEPLVQWVSEQEARAAESGEPLDVVLLETAGGVFSPLSPSLTNYDLAVALTRPGDQWLLMGADALGVLHDMSASLRALQALGRLPEQLGLSASRAADASTGTNGAELRETVLPQLFPEGQGPGRLLELTAPAAPGASGLAPANCELFVSEWLASFRAR